MMIGQAESQITRALVGVLPESYSKPRWYVAQTRSRHEKSVAAQLNERGVEHFLPLYEAVSQWKDRRVRLQLPLFAGYIFVRIPLRERLRALEIPSIVRLVGFGGLPVPMPDHEMEAMRNGLTSMLSVEPHPFLNLGSRVRIRQGPLGGLEGILLRRKGRYRVVLSVDLIKRSIVVNVDATDIVRIARARPKPSAASAAG
jgi:transcription antitermination factor NusG